MLISIFFVFVAASLLMLSYKKHYLEVMNKEIPNKYILYIANIVASILSLYFAIYSFGLSLGITYFVGAYGIAIVLIALILAYYKKLLIPLTALSLLLGIGLSFI